MQENTASDSTELNPTSIIVNGECYNVGDKIKLTTIVHGTPAGTVALVAEVDPDDRSMPVGITDPDDSDELLWLEPGQFEPYVFNFEQFPVGSTVVLTVDGVTCYSYDSGDRVVLTKGTKVEIVNHDPAHSTEHIEVKVDGHTSVWLTDNQFGAIEIKIGNRDADGFELVALDMSAEIDCAFVLEIAGMDPLFESPEKMATLYKDGNRTNIYVISGTVTNENGLTAKSNAVYVIQDGLIFRFQVLESESINVESLDSDVREKIDSMGKFIAVLMAPNNKPIASKSFDTKLEAVKWCAMIKLPDDLLTGLKLYALITGNGTVG